MFAALPLSPDVFLLQLTEFYGSHSSLTTNTQQNEAAVCGSFLPPGNTHTQTNTHSKMCVITAERNSAKTAVSLLEVFAPSQPAQHITDLVSFDMLPSYTLTEYMCTQICLV